MEKAQHVYVIKGNFGWSDIGSWDEVYRITPKDAEGNCLTGKVITKDTSASETFLRASFCVLPWDATPKTGQCAIYADSPLKTLMGTFNSKRTWALMASPCDFLSGFGAGIFVFI